MSPAMQPSINRKSLLIAVSCYSFWGFFPLYWKWLTHIDAIETLMHRILWASAFYGIILLVKIAMGGKIDSRATARDWLIAIVAGLLMSVNWGVFIYAVNISKVLEASLAYFISPLLNVAVGVVLFREPFPRLLKFAFIMAMIGVSIQIFAGDSFPWIALTLAGSFCIYGALKKIITIPATRFSLMESIPLVIPALFGAIYFRSTSEQAFVMLDWWLLAGGGVVTGIPLLLFAIAAQRLPYSIMGMIQFLGPSIQFTLAVLFFHEEFTTSYMITFAFIWIGVGSYVIDRIRVAMKLRKASSIPLANPVSPN